MSMSWAGAALGRRTPATNTTRSQFGMYACPAIVAGRIIRPPVCPFAPQHTQLTRYAADANVQSISTATLRWNSSMRSEEHTSELQSRFDLVCRLLLEKK